jgi:2-methylcitrate dehydratase PrpD
MPFCVAAAVLYGRVDVDTFEDRSVADPALAAIRSRITMTVDPTLDANAPPLTQSRVTIRLRDGRVLTAAANGARGYHERPATDQELGDKFMACAMRVLDEAAANAALRAIRGIERLADVRELTALLQPPAQVD